MKALLIIWIGWGHAQTLAIDHFDTMEECQAVVKVMANKSEELVGECLPYKAGTTVKVPLSPGDWNE